MINGYCSLIAFHKLKLPGSTPGTIAVRLGMQCLQTKTQI